MTRFATLLACVAVLAACASSPETPPEEAGDPEPVLDLEIEVEVIDVRGEPSGAGKLLCYPDLDGVKSSKELARRLRGSSLHLVGVAGDATIPADTSMAFFIGPDNCWPVAWNTTPISTRAGVSILRLVQQVRFASISLIDESGRPIEGIAGAVTDGEFPRTMPFEGLTGEGRASDRDGRIRLAPAWWPDRGLWVQVQAPGRAPRCVELRTTMPGRDGGESDHRVVLERRRDALTFAVDDSTGRLVRPDLVRFRPGPPEGGDRLPEGHQLIAVEEGGRFNLPLGSRRAFRLEVLAEGFAPWIDEAARIETLEIRLKPLR